MPQLVSTWPFCSMSTMPAPETPAVADAPFAPQPALEKVTGSKAAKGSRPLPVPKSSTIHSACFEEGKTTSQHSVRGSLPGLPRSVE